jgi:hypothetical protein
VLRIAIISRSLNTSAANPRYRKSFLQICRDQEEASSEYGLAAPPITKTIFFTLKRSQLSSASERNVAATSASRSNVPVAAL